MRRGTTPQHTFTLPFGTSIIQALKITYAQNNKVILEKYLDDCEISDNAVSVTLSQSETFLFAENVNVEIQVRVLTIRGDALTSDVRVVSTDRCLDTEVLQ